MITVISASERILIHLLLRERSDPGRNSPSGQDLISMDCQIGRTHVPRALKPLVKEDLVKESTGRISGRSRRVKVYSLTGKGTDEAASLLEMARACRLEWTDPDRVRHDDPISRALPSINEILIGRGMRTLSIPAVISIGKDSISWSEIIWLSNSLTRGEARGKIELEGWEVLPPPETPSRLTGRGEILMEMARILEKDRRLVVYGERGFGKRTIVQWYLEEKNLRGLWISQSDEGCEVDPGDYDVIVMMDRSGPDPSGLLLRREKKMRSIEGLPQSFKGKTIVIREWNSGDGVAITGISRKDFVNEMVDLGLDPTFAGKIHTACRGSPEAVHFLRSCSRKELTDLASMDPDDAVFRILLGMKRDSYPYQKNDKRKLP